MGPLNGGFHKAVLPGKFTLANDHARTLHPQPRGNLENVTP